MAQRAGRYQVADSARRRAPLSRERIINTAIELLDRNGEDGLTFRVLSEHLATGPGAIYWHIANKDDLLTAASDAIIARTLNEPLASAADTPATPSATPQATIRLLALAIFDAIDQHPWIGSALTRAPGQMPMIRIVECLGRQIQALGVPDEKHWVTASALLNYILGVGGRNAANGQLARTQGLHRSDFLEGVAAMWLQLDPKQYPVARSLAGQMRAHDDRADFLAGIDLILRGIGT